MQIYLKLSPKCTGTHSMAKHFLGRLEQQEKPSLQAKGSESFPCAYLNLYESCNGKIQNYMNFYATLPYIRHFISAGCYDNDPWYLVTNLRGIQILRGFIFLNAPLNLLLCNSYRPAFSSCDVGNPSLNILKFPGIEHAPPLIGCGRSTNEPRKLYIFSAFQVLFGNTRTFMFWRIFFNIFGAYSKYCNTYINIIININILNFLTVFIEKRCSAWHKNTNILLFF